ncbi:MAG: choice-of-anchor Q domain-containing protein [Planctomycetota bacterium]
MAHTHQTIASVAASVAISLVAAAGSAQSIWHVDDDAAPGGDGVAWASAFDDLHSALELAMPGDEIWVAEGLYVPSERDPLVSEFQLMFTMPDGVALLGGFEGTETSADQRDPAAFATVISGDIDGDDLDTPLTGRRTSSNEMTQLYASLVENTGTLLFVDRTGPGTRVYGVTFRGAFSFGNSSSRSPATRNGIFVLGGEITFTDCLFERNMGDLGGAVYAVPCGEDYYGPGLSGHPCESATELTPSRVTIEGCRFLDNVSLETPPAVIAQAVTSLGSDLMISDSEFDFTINPQGVNYADALEQRAFLAADGGSLYITDTTFRHCGGIDPFGTGQGAVGTIGFRNDQPGTTATITDSTFVHNRAVQLGLVRVEFSSAVFDRCRFLGTALFDGPSIALSLSTNRATLFAVRNSVFVGARSDQGGGRHLFGGASSGDILNNTAIVDVENIDALTFDNEFNTLEFNAAIDAAGLDPLFVRNPDDGGDGWGDDPATAGTDESLNDDFGDLRLRPGSPAIDAGFNAFVMAGDTDLDGNPRLADDPGIPGNNVDLGAYEFQGVTCLADLNQDGVADPADFNAWVAAYNDGSPLADQNRDGFVNPADFNAWVRNLNAGCP